MTSLSHELKDTHGGNLDRPNRRISILRSPWKSICIVATSTDFPPNHDRVRNIATNKEWIPYCSDLGSERICLYDAKKSHLSQHSFPSIGFTVSLFDKCDV